MVQCVRKRVIHMRKNNKKGNYLDGLKKRRRAECNAFVNGVYENPY